MPDMKQVVNPCRISYDHFPNSVLDKLWIMEAVRNRSITYIIMYSPPCTAYAITSAVGHLTNMKNTISTPKSMIVKGKSIINGRDLMPSVLPPVFLTRRSFNSDMKK